MMKFIIIYNLYIKDSKCWLPQGWRGSLESWRHYFQCVSINGSEGDLGWFWDSQFPVCIVKIISTPSWLSGKSEMRALVKPLSLSGEDAGFRLCSLCPHSRVISLEQCTLTSETPGSLGGHTCSGWIPFLMENYTRMHLNVNLMRSETFISFVHNLFLPPKTVPGACVLKITAEWVNHWMLLLFSYTYPLNTNEKIKAHNNGGFRSHIK